MQALCHQKAMNEYMSRKTDDNNIERNREQSWTCNKDTLPPNLRDMSLLSLNMRQPLNIR